MDHDKQYMARALQLAANGQGMTFTNPMVGAVVVDHTGRIIGEGWHRRYGEGHAEVNALAQVAEGTDLSRATMYVTLEPCSHYGKTPPCAKLLIDRGVGRVVIATADPFAAVSGRGIAMLREAGIDVEVGLMGEEARSLNAAFITAHTEGRPFVTLKWARSADGFMARRGADGAPAPVRFSTAITQTLTHKLRAFHTAILTGAGTVEADNPRLDVRLWPCEFQPQRVVLDNRAITRPDAAVYAPAERPTIVFSRTSRPMPSTTVCHVRPEGFTPAEILHTLYREHGLTSVLVEAGPRVLSSFIDSGLWDVAREEVSPLTLGADGCCAAPVMPAEVAKSYEVDGNFYNFFTNNRLVDVKNL